MKKATQPAPTKDDGVQRSLSRGSTAQSVHFLCPPDLRRRLRRYAFEHEMTMTDLILDALEARLSVDGAER